MIRIAAADDVPALVSLRRAAAAERDGAEVADDNFGTRFARWYETESGRVTWLAEAAGEPVGMMSLAVFERMPRPGRDAGRWGYLGNAFVLPGHRDQGTGTRLLTAVLRYADERGFARVVLSPSERSVPFYRRAGFGPAGTLLLRPGHQVAKHLSRTVPGFLPSAPPPAHALEPSGAPLPPRPAASHAPSSPHASPKTAQ